MPYPYPIDPTSILGATMQQEYCPTNIFQNGSDLYWVTIEAHLGGAFTPAAIPVQVWKSSDLGATWALQDIGGAPQVLGTEPFTSYQSETSTTQAKLKTGSTTEILIPFCQPQYNGGPYGPLGFVLFDMATDTYGVPVGQGPVALGTDASDEFNRKVIAVYRPETDDYLFVYQGVRGPTGPAPANYKPMYAYAVVYDVGTATWGTPWNIAGPETGPPYGDQNWFVRDLVYVNLTPTTNRVHVFFEHWYISDGPPNPYDGDAEIWHRVIRNNNTMSALARIATNTGFFIQQPITGMVILTSDGYLAMPFARNGTVIPANQPWPIAMVFGAEAEVPVFTEYDVTSTASEQLSSGPRASASWGIMEWSSGVIRGVWPNSQETGHPVMYADFDIGTLTWGAVGVAYNHPTANYGDYLAVTKIGGGTYMVSTNKDAAPYSNFAMSFWELFTTPTPDIIGTVVVGGPQVFPGGRLAGLPIVGGPPIGGPVVPTGGALSGLPIVGGPLVGGPVVPSGGLLAGLPIVGSPTIGGPTVFTGGTVAGPVSYLIPKGGGVCPPWFRVANEYDCCLLKFSDFVRDFGLIDKMRCPYTRPRPDGMMPASAVEWWKTDSIVTPAPGEVTVLEFIVPTGYRGMLYGITLWYTGTGFVEGSGDIVWRVRVGQAWAKNFGNFQFLLGTPGGPVALTDYIQLEPQQRVLVTIDVPNGSGSIQVGTSRVLATLQGWYYPA